MFHFVDVFSIGTEMLRTNPELLPNELSDSVFNFTNLMKEGRDFYFRKAVGKDLLIVLDSASPMLTLVDTKKVLQFLQSVKFITRFSRSIGIGIMHLGVHDTKTEDSCKQMADTIIELRRIEEGQNIRRYIRVVKTIGTFHDDLYPIDIMENVGIVIHNIK